MGKPVILGTAGHIDHGKTALVRVLTGVDTDRLPEEKRRGITIELGFAPLILEGVGTVGVVDVPGHEAFVRTMLAGATGIDLALLVVAADEGVMPQTREHLAILELLGVRAGVVALTKADLVDDEWLALVSDEVESLLAGSILAGADVVPVSSLTGSGIAELRRSIAAAASTVPARDSEDLFRMPVDRAFTMKGAGTVVTGTVWSGSLSRDASVTLLPAGRVVRVRSLQSHGRASDAVGPGQRVAVGLAGVDVEQVRRGAVLVTGDGWQPTATLRADVTLLPDAPQTLGVRTAVRFHLGTADVGARIVAEGGTLSSHELKAARISLDTPIVARAGDRFVLRAGSPVATVGGGTVSDPFAPRRGRRWPVGRSPAERLELALAESGVDGVSLGALPVRLGLTPAAVATVAASLDKPPVREAGRAYASLVVGELGDRLVAHVREFHRNNSLEPGIPLQLLRSRFAAPPELVDRVLRERTAAGELAVVAAAVRVAQWAPTLDGADGTHAEEILAELRRGWHEPPSAAELATRFGPRAPEVLRFLERRGDVVQIADGRYYLADALRELVDTLRGRMEAGKAYAPAEIRDMLGSSRKYLIPLLEYCDRIGVTRRESHGRVWSGR
jgi:selenocysteine-specific elongation factor